ncbi:hypothetical protein [Methylobacterium fujisawaense]|uniref:hypothetical protein n=1 Tax=Methylobacterium fujisawaense TaxID=107400 RepID=UPI00313C0281
MVFIIASAFAAALVAFISTIGSGLVFSIFAVFISGNCAALLAGCWLMRQRGAA